MTNFEKSLNEHYSEVIPDYFTAFEKFDYMTSKDRNKRTTKHNIISHYNKGTLGTLLKKYDTIAYNVLQNEWRNG